MTIPELAEFLRTRNLNLKVKLCKKGFETQLYHGPRVSYATEKDLETSINTAVEKWKWFYTRTLKDNKYD